MLFWAFNWNNNPVHPQLVPIMVSQRSNLQRGMTESDRVNWDLILVSF